VRSEVASVFPILAHLLDDYERDSVARPDAWPSGFLGAHAGNRAAWRNRRARAGGSRRVMLFGKGNEQHTDAPGTPADDRSPGADGAPAPRVSYQVALRSLGAYLDERNVTRLNVLESNTGFAVRYQPQPEQPETEFVHLSYHDLLSLNGQLEQKRRRRAFSFAKQENEKNTYENILRALGYELDAVEAYSLLIDEINEGMLITYQYFRPNEGFNARKRMVILGADAVRTVLEDAEARRERRKSGVLSLLAG
jgi:hypothetical protein